MFFNLIRLTAIQKRNWKEIAGSL